MATMLMLEIAGGVVIGLAAFSWLRKAHRDWENRRAYRSLEKAKEVIGRNMPPPVVAAKPPRRKAQISD
jgi:hypothetical protein